MMIEMLQVLNKTNILKSEHAKIMLINMNTV